MSLLKKSLVSMVSSSLASYQLPKHGLRWQTIFNFQLALVNKLVNKMFYVLFQITSLLCSFLKVIQEQSMFHSYHFDQFGLCFDARGEIWISSFFYLLIISSQHYLCCLTLSKQHILGFFELFVVICCILYTGYIIFSLLNF